MSISGFYSIQFSSGSKAETGVIIITGDKVYGGDGGYLYSGSIKEIGDKNFSIYAKVAPMNQDALSVFGTKGKSYDLTLNGRIAGASLQLEGENPFGAIQLK